MQRAVADVETEPTHVAAQDRARPVRDWNPYVSRLSARLRDDLRSFGGRERARGRPGRGASASFSTTLPSRNRSFHSSTVESLTPSRTAASCPVTPSASRSAACARSAMRRSTVPSRSSRSSRSRSEAVSERGMVRRPPCTRLAHGVESIMSTPLQRPVEGPQIFDRRN